VTACTAARASVGALRAKFDQFLPHLDERRRRIYLASEAAALGHGGITLVAAASGASAATIARGIAELSGRPLPAGRIRAPGAGRKPVTVSDPGLLPALEVRLHATSFHVQDTRQGETHRVDARPRARRCRPLHPVGSTRWSGAHRIVGAHHRAGCAPSGPLSGRLPGRGAVRVAVGGAAADRPRAPGAADRPQVSSGGVPAVCARAPPLHPGRVIDNQLRVGDASGFQEDHEIVVGERQAQNLVLPDLPGGLRPLRAPDAEDTA
jgi:hypothetical protein